MLELSGPAYPDESALGLGVKKALDTENGMCFNEFMTSNRSQRMPKIPVVPEEERTPLTVALLDNCYLQQEMIQEQREQIQALKDEIARLKGEKPRPKIRPSLLEKDSGRKEGRKGNRPGSAKKSKTRKLTIHETVVVPPDNLPEGSQFKGYDDFTVQDIVFRPHNTLYLLERWQTPLGNYAVGKLPENLEGGHYGPALKVFVLYQYYHAHVTQPLIAEHLLEVGIDISSGQINRIITEGKESFHAEKDEILIAGLEVSRYIHVDDTGARHQGRNGYCTHIGNELFAFFESTESKSRINFLTLLRVEHSDYVLSDDALEYMRAQKLPKAQLERLTAHEPKIICDQASFQAALQELDITGERHVRIVTEGALLGSVLEHGFNPKTVIISDDAGQFNVLMHALCWIHAERTINKLVGLGDPQREAIANVRTRIWDFYDDLKVYKEEPGEEKKAELQARFDDLFTTKTCCMSLNHALKRIHKNKSELLLVLERPDIPLQNNLSERDIREYVKKRKISGSTRSEHGRRCRDTFASLKKTCRKHGISFWEYLGDRVSGQNVIPPLSEVVRQQARASPILLERRQPVT